jgi:hypothetical protein
MSFFVSYVVEPLPARYRVHLPNAAFLSIWLISVSSYLSGLEPRRPPTAFLSPSFSLSAAGRRHPLFVSKMRVALCFLALSVLAVYADDSSLDADWEDFKQRYGKSYESGEEVK